MTESFLNLVFDDCGNSLCVWAEVARPTNVILEGTNENEEEV